MKPVTVIYIFKMATYIVVLGEIKSVREKLKLSYDKLFENHFYWKN